MSQDQIPFRTGWWSFELGPYRACDSTYCLFPYESLPPLDASLFTGEFQWLADLSSGLERLMEAYRLPRERRSQVTAKLERLAACARQMGLELPAPFARFMGSPYLQDQMPSCTACYFDLPDRLVKSPAGDGGYLVRFLNDQQDVLLWYLYLNARGEHGVVVSPLLLDDEEAGNVSDELAAGKMVFCAPTFETFLYRFWLENKIWFALNAGSPLTSEQRDYVLGLARRNRAPVSK